MARKSHLPDIPAKYRPLVGDNHLPVRDRRGRRQRIRTAQPLSKVREHRKFRLNQLPGRLPTLHYRELHRAIMDAAGVDQPTAARLLRAIVQQMTAAVRVGLTGGHEHVVLRDLGTFWLWKHNFGHRFDKGRKGPSVRVRFRPHPSWHAPWMPVVAYDDTGQPVGIYDGPRVILPWGHPDNPYPTPDDVPLDPDRSWVAATPLPGQSKRPPRAPESASDDPHLTPERWRANTRRRL